MTAIPPSMAPTTANWHWKNKNVTPWAKTWFERELVTLSVNGEGDESASIAEVLEVDGDVELGQRKSKLITIYDCKVHLKWTGVAKDGTEVEGNLTIPEVSHEITLDGLSDYVYNWTLKTASTPDVDAVYKLARSLLPTALETKFAAFPSALIETHGKDLTVSAQPSRTGTPAPGAPGSSTPAGGAASGSSNTKVAGGGAAKPVKPKALNTTKIKVDGTFMASAEDLFSLMTDEKRIPSWTRAPAQSKAQPDTEYTLFGGGVKGKYISLSPPNEIKQTWSLQSPTWPSGHVAVLTTTFEQSTDHTVITWTLEGVPLSSEEEITRNLQGYYVHGLKSIGYVQISLTPPQHIRSTSTKSSSSSLSASSNQRYIAVAFAALALTAAFAIPLIFASSPNS